MNHVPLPLEKQTVLITGAGDSVGLAIGRRFVASGAKAHIVDVNQEAVEQALAANPGLSGSVADVGSADEVQRVFLAAERAMGQVDVVVNAVGIAGPIGPIATTPIDEWRRTIDINLNSMFYTTRLAAPGMKQRGFGVIINFSTTAVLTRSLHRASYVVSKVGVEKLTYATAHELGQFGVRCNAIRPGAINNRRMERILVSMAERDGTTIPEAKSRMLQSMAMRSMIEIDELVDMVVFLASPAAKHITAQVIGVCGGDG
jgi:NAD(P)-dependent dehydrogenase (short-subunit alcohol dehydrogenase family)